MGLGVCPQQGRPAGQRTHLSVVRKIERGINACRRYATKLAGASAWALVLWLPSMRTPPYAGVAARSRAAPPYVFRRRSMAAPRNRVNRFFEILTRTDRCPTTPSRTRPRSADAQERRRANRPGSGHKKALPHRRALKSRYVPHKTAGRTRPEASAYSAASVVSTVVSTVSTASTGTSTQAGAESTTAASSSMPSSASFMR